MAKRHKWDIISDTCEVCGLMREQRPSFAPVSLAIKGYYTQYSSDNGNTWVAKRPECKTLK